MAGWAALAWMMMAGQPARGEPLSDEDVEAVLPKIRALVESSMKDSGVPGVALAVVHNDRVVMVEGFGICKVGELAKVDGDTIFQLASVSKPMTSTVIARLVGEGKLSWDDPVVKCDPAFQLKDAYVTTHVTFRDLLSHRSGLPDHAGDLLEDLGYSREIVLARLRNFDLGNRFRAAYAYTNFGVTEAAVAAAATTGKKWDELIGEELFKPLGMSRTSARFEDFRNAKNRVSGHVPDNEKLIADGKWVAKYVRDPDAQSPAGGVSSTARDVAQWIRLQLAQGRFEGEALIKPEALAETHKPQILTSYDDATGKAGFYGLCWIISTDDGGRVFWKHSGEFQLGARSVVSLCPAEGLGIVVLANAAPSGLPEGIELSFYDLLFRKKLTRDWVSFANGKFQEMTNEQLMGDGVEYEKAPADAKPARSVAAYEGTYLNDVYGPLQIEIRSGDLVATFGSTGAKFPLKHYSGDLFYGETQGEMMSGRSGVDFNNFVKGKANMVTLNFLNREGMGTFQRQGTK